MKVFDKSAESAAIPHNRKIKTVSSLKKKVLGNRRFSNLISVTHTFYEQNLKEKHPYRTM